MSKPLQISNISISEQEFNEFKETHIGKFILYYLEAKIISVLQDTPNSIMQNVPPSYSYNEMQKIYNELKSVMDSLKDAEKMRLSMKIISEKLNLKEQ